MVSKKQLEVLEKKKARLEKLRAEIRDQDAKIAAAKRKERKTALCTIGGCFAAILENDETRDKALQLWDRFLAEHAPTNETDGRYIALQEQFGLGPKEVLESPESRPPSAESPGALPQTPGYLQNSDGAREL
tara:strand:- start:262 stop:657 length:396 start_codon:yes stop_codon:yes gene_type:complete